LLLCGGRNRRGFLPEGLFQRVRSKGRGGGSLDRRPSAQVTNALCSIQFDRDAGRPSRVENEAKACLDEIALNMQRSSDTKPAIGGNAACGEIRAE
jgi:hypothetical protein